MNKIPLDSHKDVKPQEVPTDRHKDTKPSEYCPDVC